MSSLLARHWSLEPGVTYLNHGSFGACPTVVREAQTRWRNTMERQPVHFFMRQLEAALDTARASLAKLLNAEASDLAWTRNATMGVNAVLGSIPLRSQDELLTTNHAYNACHNALKYVADRDGARVVVAIIPFPVASEDQVVEAVLSKVTSRTRLALLDHVTSPTGLIMPVAKLIEELSSRDVETLIDGAHAPGMIEVDLKKLNATYYVGNCHKWLCAPKGAAFLHVTRERQPQVRPNVISHGANSRRQDRSRFLLEFDWIGTDDPSAVLCVPDAIEFLRSLFPGGIRELREHNRQLALAARHILCSELNVPPPAPDSMIAAMASLPLPDSTRFPASCVSAIDPLQDQLWQEHRIEIPAFPWPEPPHRLIRLSAQAYNRISQYEFLADVTARLLERK